MFNPEKLLGGLLQSGMGKNVGMMTKAGAGLAALGVAWAAVEHYLDNKAAQPTTSSAGPGAAPPPPPGAATPGVAPPPPPPGAAPVPAKTDPVLLIQAMIAAAAADGAIDDAERQAIWSKLDREGLSDEDRVFLEKEMASPASAEDIASRACSPDDARQVYLASLLAIDVDTDAERDHLARLAQALDLPQDFVQKANQRFGVA